MPHPYATAEGQTRAADLATGLAKDVLARHAAEVDQKARFPEESVKALAEKGLFGLCVSEKLAEKGDGWSTNPQKSWVTAARRADYYVSSAQRPGAASPLESTCYLLKRDASGVRAGPAFDGLGLRGNDSTPVTLEDVRVAKADLLTGQ